ncbi:HD domain-containing protein [Methanobacterium alkalithermotolerans]|uniref:HD domain-containing protein n=1 Tax=Methanobacterium alkalithermotolerans TaxID=2731220 RepID=A0A8T8K4X3_9EURY|nr:HD domain-containing protein [Methanobacterium alkalithermotolerans]QUH22959.1 HD domain-containing protein [Methanobacterium alkalithermotolerans]RJS48225.1 MAG: phosphohydrolase [Methanobacterium sp.]
MYKKDEKDLVENLNSNREVISQFVISNKEIKRAKTGKKYLQLTLSDKTGQIAGRLFPEKNIDEISDSIKSGSIYRIKGKVSEFPRSSGNFSAIINNFKELEPEEYDLNDYIQTSRKDKDLLLLEIYSTIKSLENKSLKELLKSFFCDEEFTSKFSIYPSAQYYHHNFKGGLLEHTVGVLEICKTTCQIFPELDPDLLFTGAILHDIGKMQTYDYDFLSISYSRRGDLLDHLFLTAEMVKEKINKLDMDEELANQVLHLILSHHGEVKNGWGSPVNPKIPEAVALHHADNLDAKVKGMLQQR